MAYIDDINEACGARGCQQKATVRVFMSSHQAVGDYCLAHGHERRQQLQQLEDRAKRTPPPLPPLVTR